MSKFIVTGGAGLIGSNVVRELNARGEADILIVDYHLDNGHTGADLVQQLNARRSAPLPVLMITANYSNDLKLQMRELGQVLMHKPVRPMKLKTAMSHLLERGRG